MRPTMIMRGLRRSVAENPLRLPFVGGVEVVDLAGGWRGWCSWRDSRASGIVGAGGGGGLGSVIEPETGVV